MQSDQRLQAVAEGKAVALAGLARQRGARLDLGDRVIPVPRGEALQHAGALIVPQSPADAEFLADPYAGFDRGPGLIEPVKRHEDETAGDVDRSYPAWALAGQPYRIVGDLERIAEVPAVMRDHGERRH